MRFGHIFVDLFPAIDFVHMLHQERKKPWQQFLKAVRVPEFTNFSQLLKDIRDEVMEIKASNKAKESTVTASESEPKENDVLKRKRKTKIKTKTNRDDNQTDEEEMEERKEEKKEMKKLAAFLVKKKATEGREDKVTQDVACGHVTNGTYDHVTNEVYDHTTMEDLEALTQAHVNINENKISLLKPNR